MLDSIKLCKNDKQQLHGESMIEEEFSENMFQDSHFITQNVISVIRTSTIVLQHLCCQCDTNTHSNVCVLCFVAHKCYDTNCHGSMSLIPNLTESILVVTEQGGNFRLQCWSMDPIRDSREKDET
ncbi:hypothetical protein OUZ56_011641 [Daphnia magna]|uniref:Uncharacterized protein n=1 Tax=Daphnia magna TaxID=35525 RepID=A0ABQ9Z0Q0_9CRUS|nr:hypothetical protein OUZ56_011641 [Daphnia magna]